MQLVSILLLFAALIISEYSEAAPEKNEAYAKRGLHFFRLRRSSACVAVPESTIAQIKTFGICPTSTMSADELDDYLP
ncbi:hypothetical protein SprV_0802518400 [Sparganum proliferum]